MPPSRTQYPQPTGEDQLSTAYSLLLLSEYTHTLDSLPLDLSRNFADLRELDAVLSSSMYSITGKIDGLTTMIEEGTVSKEQRLWLLNEIADEAGRLKLGGEDKIRVACQAADNLRTHNNHLRNLADSLPGFDTSVLIRKTTYPHVSAQSFMPVHTAEHGRRRRNVMGSLLTAPSNTTDPSPAKRKRMVNRDDDVDIGNLKSPRKERVETNGRGRVNNRVKRVNERATSPTESVLSVNYRQASQNARSTASNSRTGVDVAASANKRSRGNATTNSNSNNRHGTPLANDYNNNSNYDPRFPGAPIVQQNGSSRRDAYNGASSNLAAYPNAAVINGVGNHQQIMQAYDIHSAMHLQNWNPATGQPLEGPGMPVSRSTGAHVAAAAAASMAVDNSGLDGTDGDGEADDTRYCFCNGVSYGEMIACDDDTCEREWFHLACTNLNAPPSGKWFCDDCKSKRNAKRTGRGGRRRAGGGRASGKA